MKVLVEVDSSDTRIGAVNDVLDLMKNSGAVGLDYTLCGPVQGDLLAQAQALNAKVVFKKSMAISKKGIVGYTIDVIHWLLLLIRIRPDVIHINYGAWGPSLVCAGKILRIPVVARAVKYYNGKNMTFKWVDRYVANCQAQAEGLLTSPVGDRVVVVGDLINYDRLKKVVTSKPLYHPSSKEIRLLFLGQIVKRKGLDVLVDAVRAIDLNFKLYLVGGNWDEGGYAEEIKQKINVHNLTEKVITCNHRDDAMALMRECDIFVLPSLSEARPRSIIEAMLLGRCVVSTKVGGIPGLIDTGRTGVLVEPGDPDALASKLRRLIDDTALRNRLSWAAKVESENHFDIQITMSRYKSVYDELVGTGC